MSDDDMQLLVHRRGRWVSLTPPTLGEDWPPPRKIRAEVPMSFEMLIANGVMTEEEAVAEGWVRPAPVSRRTLWRWALREWWWAHKPHMHLGPCDHGDCG